MKWSEFKKQVDAELDNVAAEDIDILYIDIDDSEKIVVNASLAGLIITEQLGE